MIDADIGIVSDEISPSFSEAARLGLSWGIRRYEIRMLETGRIPEVEAAEWESVRALAARENIRIGSLSPGFFKCALADRALIERQIGELLPRAIEMAKSVGAATIVVFGFQKDPGDPPDGFLKAAAHLRRAAEIGARAGMIVAVENEPGFWCDTGSRTAEIIEAADSPALKANWDPANAFGCGENPFPEGYERIRRHIAGVHAKDTARGALVECLPIGEGKIDWRGQIAALVRDGREHLLTIETHCLPLAEHSRRNLETLKGFIRAATVGAKL